MPQGHMLTAHYFQHQCHMNLTSVDLHKYLRIFDFSRIVKKTKI